MDARAVLGYNRKKSGGRNTMKTIAVIDDDIHIGNFLEELLQREIGRAHV